ncbi:hypothetical protein HK104_004719, partial [Borealophlyctis nickersoniae]
MNLKNLKPYHRPASSPNLLSQKSSSDDTNADWSTYRIAVVDDNDINLKIICKLLKMHLNITIDPADQFTDGSFCLNALTTRT